MGSRVDWKGGLVLAEMGEESLFFPNTFPSRAGNET